MYCPVPPSVLIEARCSRARRSAGRALELFGCGAISDAAAFFIYLAATPVASVIQLARPRLRPRSRAQRAQAGCRVKLAAPAKRDSNLHLGAKCLRQKVSFSL